MSEGLLQGSSLWLIPLATLAVILAWVWIPILCAVRRHPKKRGSFHGEECGADVNNDMSDGERGAARRQERPNRQLLAVPRAESPTCVRDGHLLPPTQEMMAAHTRQRPPQLLPQNPSPRQRPPPPSPSPAAPGPPSSSRLPQSLPSNRHAMASRPLLPPMMGNHEEDESAPMLPRSAGGGGVGLPLYVPGSDAERRRSNRDSVLRAVAPADGWGTPLASNHRRPSAHAFHPPSTGAHAEESEDEDGTTEERRLEKGELGSGVVVAFEDGDVYVGERNEKGEPHGQGSYNFADRSQYQGNWRFGKKHGFGKFHFTDGDRYEGEYSDDTMHGQGRYFFAELGDEYEGEFKRDTMHGQGTFRYANKDIYRGEFRDDKMHGVGFFSFFEGATYEGEYRSDAIHGQGKFCFADKISSYEGEWRFGKKWGQGKYIFPSGDSYEGSYRDDRMDGFGIYRYKEGDIYEGGFREGKKQGFGRAYFADGDSYVGNYENDKMCGRGVYKSADGDVFDGEYSGDMMNGMGKFLYSDGAIFEGYMKDDEKHGNATYKWAEGAVAVVQYRAGEPIGEGARWSADRRRAYRLQAGRKVERISLEKAAKIAKSLGLQMPEQTPLRGGGGGLGGRGGMAASSSS